MTFIRPLPESEATDKTEQTYGRLKETLASTDVPELFQLMGRVPPFLHDFYMNFKKFVLGEGHLNSKERMAIALAASLNAGDAEWTQHLRTLAGDSISDSEYAELAAVVAACSMYNTFFKFRELSGSDLFSGMSVGLRAQTFHAVSLGDRLVELVNTAISNLNACKPCTEGHVTKAQQLGITNEAILEAIQCAAVIQSAVKFHQAAG